MSDRITSSITRRNLNGRIADIAEREGVSAEFKYSDTEGGRMLWFLDDGRVLTPGEFADLLGVARWSAESFLAGGS